MKRFQIAIDGPVASGKSTISLEVARRLGYLYIDTGAMYRAVTWKALKEGTDFTDEEALAKVAKNCDIKIRPEVQEPLGYRLHLDGEDITDNLHHPQVSDHVSLVAKVGAIRRILVARQREMARDGGVVMAGRDITSVVIPDAELKIYLTATEEERVRRRSLEMEEKGTPVSREALQRTLRMRDEIDSNREDSPLMITEDSLILDTTGKSIPQVVEEVLALVWQKKEK